MDIDKENLMKFYEIAINISGILFPTFQAILYFIIEKSFNRLEIMKQELISFYKKRGNIITLTLIYLIIQSLFQLLSFEKLSYILLHIFTLTLFFLRLELFHFTGSRETINSTKYIPDNFNKVQRYIKACLNNDLIEYIKLFLFIVFFLVSFFTKDSIFFSTLSTLVYSIISISILLSDPIGIQKYFLKQENTQHELGNNEYNRSREKILLEEENIGKQMSGDYLYKEMNKKDNSGIFYFSHYPQIKDTGELRNNIFLNNISINNKDILKNRIIEISKSYLIKLAECRTDINSFVMSFHFELESKKKNIFIRTTKDEIENNKNVPLHEFFTKFKNVLIDEIFK